MANFMDGGSPQPSERVNIQPKTVTEADFQFKASFLKNSHFRIFHVNFCFILKPKSSKNCLKKVEKIENIFSRQMPPKDSRGSQIYSKSL